MYLRGDKRGLVHQISLEACRLHRKDCTRTENCISIRQPTTAQPTTNRAQSNLFELPGCEGGNRKVTFRASIHTAYRDRKIKENQNAFLERIEIIPTDKDYLSQDEVICLSSTPCSAPALKRAFLFSCLTALRKNDIKKLTWPILFHQSNHNLLLFSMPYKHFLKKPCDFCTFCLLPLHAL